MEERTIFLLSTAVIFALAVLSAIFPAINVVMTVLVVVAFVAFLGAGVALLVHLNTTPRIDRSDHVPPEGARARSKL